MNEELVYKFERRAKRQAVRAIRNLVAAAVFLAILMWSFIAWSLWSEYSAARRNGRTEGYNLTAAFASELSMTFDSASATLRLIEGIIREKAPGPAATEGLRSAIAAAAGPDTEVWIAGTDGHLLLATSPTDGRPTDVSQEPHFIAHRDDPSSGLIIAAPPSAAAKKAIEVSRRLETADGRFAGEAMLLLKPVRLITLNRQIDIGGRGMIVIAGTDGIIRAGFDQNHVDGEYGVGTDLRGGPYPDDLPPGGTVAYIRRARLDGIERLISVRRLERYPLRVLVALDLDDVLGSARSHVWLIGLVGVGATLLIAILTFLLGREVWRRTRREVELAHDRDQLRSAQEQIQQDHARLDETDRQLQASKASADAANRARSQFLAHMSHELRTPLHAIIGFSELIQDQAPDRPGSPPIAGYAADIWSSGRHLLELINSILDISKVESGTTRLAEMIFPVAELARNSLVSVRAQAEAHQIPITLDLPETTLRVRGDQTRLLQVLINLLSNAVKFTPDNGRIILAAKQTEAGELVFSVTDTGIGMTETEIEIAFEPFGQVDNTLARSFEGTGLGLPLARKLTELHGGRLELVSVKGKGTIATVVLPSERVQQHDGVPV